MLSKSQGSPSKTELAENQSKSPVTGFRAEMPREPDIIPTWRTTNEGTSHGNGNSGEAGPSAIVRTHAPPAGPHPYLDRFASGMHRPLEGEYAIWIALSIAQHPLIDFVAVHSKHLS